MLSGLSTLELLLSLFLRSSTFQGVWRGSKNWSSPQRTSHSSAWKLRRYFATRSPLFGGRLGVPGRFSKLRRLFPKNANNDCHFTGYRITSIEDWKMVGAFLVRMASIRNGTGQEAWWRLFLRFCAPNTTFQYPRFVSSAEKMQASPNESMILSFLRGWYESRIVTALSLR